MGVAGFRSLCALCALCVLRGNATAQQGVANSFQGGPDLTNLAGTRKTASIVDALTKPLHRVFGDGGAIPKILIPNTTYQPVRVTTADGKAITGVLKNEDSYSLGRTGQSCCAADGSREGLHDAERIHTGDRRRASDGRGQGRIRIVHNCSQTGKRERAKSLKKLAAQAGFEPATLRLTVASAFSANELYRASSSNKHGRDLTISVKPPFVRTHLESHRPGAQKEAQYGRRQCVL